MLQTFEQQLKYELVVKFLFCFPTNVFVVWISEYGM